MIRATQQAHYAAQVVRDRLDKLHNVLADNMIVAGVSYETLQLWLRVAIEAHMDGGEPTHLNPPEEKELA